MVNEEEYDEEEDEDDYGLTPEQLKALMNLKKAFLQCQKLGIEFWDDYGCFMAYDSKKIG